MGEAVVCTLSADSRQREHTQTLPQAGRATDSGQLQTGTDGVHQIHQPGFQRSGKGPAQRPHVGENDVLLLGGQVGECRGVAGGEAGMIEALVAGVGGFVLGIIQVQVVE